MVSKSPSGTHSTSVPLKHLFSPLQNCTCGPPPGLQCQRSAAFYIWRSWALVRVVWANMSPHWREGPCPALSGWIQPHFCQLIRAAVVPSPPGPFLPVHLHSKHSLKFCPWGLNRQACHFYQTKDPQESLGSSIVPHVPPLSSPYLLTM